MKIKIIAIVFGICSISSGILGLFGIKIMDSGLAALVTFIGAQLIIEGSSRLFLSFGVSRS